MSIENTVWIHQLSSRTFSLFSVVSKSWGIELGIVPMRSITSLSNVPEFALKAQLRAPGNKPTRGKVLQTYLSSLRQERVGRAGVLVCLAARSSLTRSDPPTGRGKRVATANCHDNSVENDDRSVENGGSPRYLWSCAFKTVPIFVRLNTGPSPPRM